MLLKLVGANVFAVIVRSAAEGKPLCLEGGTELFERIGSDAMQLPDLFLAEFSQLLKTMDASPSERKRWMVFTHHSVSSSNKR